MYSGVDIHKQTQPLVALDAQGRAPSDTTSYILVRCRKESRRSSWAEQNHTADYRGGKTQDSGMY